MHAWSLLTGAAAARNGRRRAALLLCPAATDLFVRHHMSRLFLVRRARAVLLAASLLVAGNAGATGTTCPLAAGRVAGPEETTAIAEDRSCLVDAGAIGNRSVFDLRTRAEFLDFHLPGARHSSRSALMATGRRHPAEIVAYDSGKSRSATFLLCSQLRRAGLTRFKLIDGGIAAWAQRSKRAERLSTNRLGDAEVVAALSDRRATAIALTAPLKAILAEHRLGAPASPPAIRRIVLADPAMPLASVDAQLATDKGTTFYWIGTHQQLRDLIHAHLLQGQKRLAGPVQSTACSAL